MQSVPRYRTIANAERPFSLSRTPSNFREQSLRVTDYQCLGFSRFLHFYRDIAAAIYPVIPDLKQFEVNVDALLRNRAGKSNGESMDRPFGMSMAFIGLLFAILAAGCQSSDLPGKERELTSQVYGTLYSGDTKVPL